MSTRSPYARRSWLHTIRDYFAQHRLLLIAPIALAVILWWQLGSTTLPFRSNYRSQLGAATTSGASTQGPVKGAAAPVLQFKLIVANGVYTGEEPALEADLKRTFEYVARRFSERIAGGQVAPAPFQAGIALDNQCRLHGISYPDEHIVQAFTCNDIPSSQTVAILAHEFGHQLEYDYFGPGHITSDVILAEGVATWAAGEYWLGGQPDFRSLVPEQRNAGTFYPLATDSSGQGAESVNALYYQWASFVEFLLDNYSHEQFEQIYKSGNFSVGSADYTGVYGKSLSVLEREWQDWLGT